MGLIKAGAGALGGSMADQWKEFFTCSALDQDVLVARGVKQTSGRSSNVKGHDNVISNGSGIAVADGQCMMILEQGKIVEFCAEPGEFTWDSSTEPSLFTGKLGDSLKETFRLIGKRFTFGGDTAKDQRVYYFNTKEILDNKFGTANPFLFTVVNKRIGMDRTVSVRCNGVYSYKITDPLLFYKEVCGNVEREYTREEIDGQLKTEFVDALQPAFAKLSELELRPAQIPAHTVELQDAMNEALRAKWTERRGLTVVSIAMNPISLTEEDLKKVQQMEDAAAYGSSPNMMAGRMGEATATAMETAAANEGGAMNAFLGMGMAMNTGAGNVQNLYAMGQQQAQQAAQQNAGQAQPGTQAPQAGATAATWTCSCGTQGNTGNFCGNCGNPRPAPSTWTCSCGTENQGNFCGNCGKPRP